MISDPYPKAPITEAIIEIRVKSEIDEKLIKSLKDSFSKSFSDIQERFKIKTEYQTERKSASTSLSFDGFRLASEDETRILILQPFGIAFAQLPPYKDWNEFSGFALKHWKIWRQKTPKSDLTRIGIRYVNRIDVPFSDKQAHVNVGDYLNIDVEFPNIENILKTKFLAQLEFYDKTTLWHSRVASTILDPSPLINCMSFLLDIDVYKTHELPLKTEEVWELLREGREIKNNIFESCITNKARELFQ